MDEKLALRIVKEFYLLEKDSIFEINEFMCALDYLALKNQNTLLMMDAGNYFFEKKYYEFSLKYYEMASQYKCLSSYEGLGNVYFFGFHDYEKAFHFYSLAKGSLFSMYYIACMYRDGLYVKKDEELYKEMILSLFDQLKDGCSIFDPICEVYYCMAHIFNSSYYLEKAYSTIKNRLDVTYKEEWDEFKKKIEGELND